MLKILWQNRKEAFFVTVDTYVTMEDGTGIVHIATAGDDDARIGKSYNFHLSNSSMKRHNARSCNRFCWFVF